MAVLDSTFLSDFLTGKKATERVLEALEADDEPLRVPAAVWVEVLHALPVARRAAAARVLERATVFEPFTRELADAAAALQHELRRTGSRLGWHDLQIATTALRYQEVLVSNDEGFDAVGGLERRSH